MQRTEERTSESTATAEANATLLNSEEDDFEILSTEILEEKITKMSEKTAKLRGVMKVKAVLQREGQGVGGSNPEIRRFSVSEANFKALVTSVRSVFNIDPEQQCSLSWKDDDGDLIQFSTTQELRHALDSMPDETLRIHVTVTPEVTEVSKKPEEEKEKAGATVTKEVTVETPSQGSTFLYPPLPTDTPSAPDMPCDRKSKMAQKMAANKQKNEEFNEVRQQVPEKFRRWVRNYVRTWFQQGAEAANQIDTLPEGAPPHFRQWLHDFTSDWTQKHAGTAADKETGRDEGEKEEKELLSAPEGLPPLYYRWICLFMPRFCPRFAKKKTAIPVEKDGGPEPQCPDGHDRRHGHASRQGKGHHGCHGKKGGKRDDQSSSSESEGSDSGEKMWKKVPKAFRKYVRVSVKQLHKNKGDNLKAKEKATRAGLSPEVLEFVEQILLEWHAKLSHKAPRDVAMEMMEGERSLPAGLERDHFLWLCRFMARWHRRHAGKCDVMSGWSSGETDDSSSGEEGQGACGPWGRAQRRHFRAAMRGMHGHPHGMMGHPYHPFPTHHGMEHGCPPPPAPPMFGCPPPPPPPPYCGPDHMTGCGMMPPGHMMGFGCKRGWQKDKRQGCKRWKNQDGVSTGQTETTHDDMVEHVTEGVKKL